MVEVKLSVVQAQALERFVAAHMENCYVSVDSPDLVDEGWEPFDPFCGCDTCVSREYFMATFEFLRSIDAVDVFVEG